MDPTGNDRRRMTAWTHQPSGRLARASWVPRCGSALHAPGHEPEGPFPEGTFPEGTGTQDSGQGFVRY